MKNSTIPPKRETTQKNLKPLSKDLLETIVGGPITARGTYTKVGD